MTNVKIENLVKRPIFQVCFIVKDCRKAAEFWANVMGAGPFTYGDPDHPVMGMDKVWVNGEMTSWRHCNCVGQWGDVQVELLQFLDTDSDSFVELGENEFSKLHHMNYFVDNMAEEEKRLAALGVPKVWEARIEEANNFHICFFDAREQLGCILEVYEENAAIRQGYAGIRWMHENWDGEKLFIEQ